MNDGVTLKNGRVIYSSGGNYKVLVDGKVYFSKPKGIFRKTKTRILVGDIVDLIVGGNKDELNIISHLYERKNQFDRPLVSNIDYAIIVSSLVEPKLDKYLIDKLICLFKFNNINPLLILTKYDISEDKDLSFIEEYKREGVRVFVKSVDNFEEFFKIISDSFSIITGQTGVGKSTFINEIADLNIETNEISKRLGRGKHTTRHSEAHEIRENTYIVDSPGFSSFELDKMSQEDISNFFFSESHSCKFTNCSHISESGCKIKELIEKNKISESRYDNYKKLIKKYII